MSYSKEEIERFGGAANIGNHAPGIDEFFNNASTQELAYYISRIGMYHKVDTLYFNRAQVALQIRLSLDAATTANKLIQHTEKLTQQTDVMIEESKKLGRLTWALIWLTVALAFIGAVQVALMIYDIWKRK